MDIDGIVDQGEFTMLNDLGINSINLVSDGQSFMLGNGEVIVYGSASFTSDDGSVGLVHDVGFGATFDLSNAQADLSWTNVVDIAATTDPSITVSGSGQIDLQGAAQADGDWTVIVNSGNAVYHSDSNEIVFTTEHDLNSASITAPDGTVQQVSDVDKIQWNG